MNGRRALGTCAVALGVLLASGCATTVRGQATADPAIGPGEAVAPSTDPPSSSSSAPAAPGGNARGNIEKQIGEEAGVTGTDGSDLMTFTVDAIQVDYPCSGDYPQPPENGHFVGLSMHITTAPNLPADSFVDINATDFSFIGGDGVTVSNVDTFPAFTCAPDAEQLPSGPLGSGQQYVGTLVLDVPETTGIVQYQPLYLTQGGWEWHF
ncbi:hypothetical protein [Petropleomorpha daqingensis]|uniref:DUF4352 domain-containing protein n=1 Tax=Petropleomorpha daqingensis TaxID=2026353 RepID=A0A853CM30_9ACTN|nr:hypothetical protein [Petropleomorpha daqingensis]NYJ08627.1 hypothetical protein [Petropleomorpha daqingensis]